MPYASTADYNVQIVDNSGVPIVSFGGGTQYADGTAAATPTGTAVAWNDTGTERIVSAAKPLPVNVVAGSGSGLSVADAAAWTTAVSNFVPGGGVFNDSAAVLVAGTQGTQRLTTNRAAHANLRTAAGVEIGIAAAPLIAAGAKTTNAAVAGATNVGTLPAIANAAAPSLTETFQAALSVDLSGSLRVTAAGTLTNNNAAPAATNLGSLTGLANAADPSWTEGRQVLASMTLAGYQRTVVQGSVAAGATPANPISMGFLGTGTTLRNLTAANSVTATSGNDIPGVGLMINDPVTGGGNGTWSRMRDANSADNSGGTGLLGAGLVGWDGSAWRRGSVNTSGQFILASTPAEDAAHTSGDRGSFALTVRNDANASTGLAGTDLDYQGLQSNVRGDLYVVAGNHGIAIPTCTFTRGANMAAYTIGDEVGTSGTAPTTATFARLNGGSGIIYGCQVIYSNAPTVTPSLVVGVFTSTVTLAGDNAQLNLSDADHAKLICWIPLTASQDGVYSAGVRSTSGSLSLNGVPMGGRPAHYVCGGSEKTLYVCVMTLNVFTPIANSETLTVTFDQETN